ERSLENVASAFQCWGRMVFAAEFVGHSVVAEGSVIRIDECGEAIDQCPDELGERLSTRETTHRQFEVSSTPAALHEAPEPRARLTKWYAGVDLLADLWPRGAGKRAVSPGSRLFFKPLRQ